jgi:predicted DNA-binding protein
MLHRMPTVNPRLSVTLTPELAAVMDRMSALTGNSKSSLVAELLESSLPVFERMMVVLEAANQLQDQAKEAQHDVVRSLLVGQERMEEQMGLLLGQLDDATLPIVKAAEKVTRRKARDGRTAARAPGGAPTPMSNRGVRPPKYTQNRTIKGGQS